MKTCFILFGISILLSYGAYGATTDITTCTNKQQSCGEEKYCTKYGYCYPECGASLTLEYGWSNYLTGSEKRVEWCLQNGEEVSTTSYRCVAGYYGSGNDCEICPAGYYCPKDSNSTPIPCPAAKFDVNLTGGGATTIIGGDAYGPTSKTGSTAIEDCYIPANNYYRYKDATGVYTFDEDCHYGCDCYITEY